MHAKHRIPLAEPTKLYTAGYDCTLRSIDFETRNSSEVVDADLLAAAEYGEGEALLSGFDLTEDGNELWSESTRQFNRNDSLRFVA